MPLWAVSLASSGPAGLSSVIRVPPEGEGRFAWRETGPTVSPCSRVNRANRTSPKSLQGIAGNLIHAQDLEGHADPQRGGRVVGELAQHALQLGHPVAHGVVVVVQDAGRLGHVEPG